MPETILSDKETAVNKEGPACLLTCVCVNLMKYRITGAQICFEQQDYLASASLEPWFQTDYLALPSSSFCSVQFPVQHLDFSALQSRGPTILLHTLQLRIYSHIGVLLIQADHETVQPLTWPWRQPSPSQIPPPSQTMPWQGVSHKMSCFLNFRTLVPLKKGNLNLTIYCSL